MSFGIQVSRGSQVITNQTMPGGRLWLGEVIRSEGTVSETITYPQVPGGNHLRVLQLEQGAHSWATGTDASGNATLTITRLSTMPGTTNLQVFAAATREPDFGIAAVNDAGERSISSILPAMEFLGRYPLNSAPISAGPTDFGLWRYRHQVSVGNVGGGRRRIVLWQLGIESAAWFTGTSFISQSINAGLTLSGSMFCAQGTSYVTPVAYLFALQGLSNSSDTFGLRVYDGSGNLTFDAGLQHAIVRGFDPVSYGTTEGELSGHAMTSHQGITPAFLIPTYGVIRYIRIGPFSSNVQSMTGTMRRSGPASVETRLTGVFQLFEDAASNETFIRGQRTGVPSLCVNAADYGG